MSKYNNHLRKKVECWMWWRLPIIPALRRLRLEDCCKFEVRVGYVVSSRTV